MAVLLDQFPMKFNLNHPDFFFSFIYSIEISLINICYKMHPKSKRMSLIVKECQECNLRNEELPCYIHRYHISMQQNFI